jgi:predicted nucleic acid-binding protein
MGDVRRGAGAVTGTVLVDTNVFTARLRERSPLATRYAKHLFGQRIALAPQTVAEARYGALKATWGPARTEQLARLVGRARILPIDIDTIETVAELRNQCRMIGHPRSTRATTTLTSGSPPPRFGGPSRSSLTTRSSLTAPASTS